MCAFNGILDENDSCKIVERLYQIKNELEHTPNIDVNSLGNQLDKVRFEIYHIINSNPLKVRLLYLYAIHVWLFLILGILIDLVLLLHEYLTNLIVGGDGRCGPLGLSRRMCLFNVLFAKERA